MISRLIALSLIVIPFYEVILYFLVPGRSMPIFQDMRVTKDFMMMVFALAIGLSVLYKYGFKPVKIVWPMAFMMFLILNIVKAPKSSVLIGNTNIDGMWNYIPAFQIVILFIFFIGIINKEGIDILAIMRLMVWIGVAMAIFMIMQKFGADQILGKSYDYRFMETNKIFRDSPFIAGTLGNPTLASPFLSMILPIALVLKKFKYAVLMCCAIVFTESAVAIGSMFIVLWAYGARIYIIKKMMLIYCAVTSVAFGSIGVLIWMFARELFSDSGRFHQWANIITNTGSYMALTGMGIGSFKYLYALRNGNDWFQAHNEYLQLYWTCGFIGLFIVGMLLKDIFVRVIKNHTDEVFALGLSFTSLLFCALGTFVFQLGVYQFYGVLIVGMIYILTREVDYAT